MGRAGERLAAKHLERLGYAIVARNHRTRYGELDLIACDGETLVFCEVKARRAGGGAGSGVDAVAARKQRRVRGMAAAWLADVSDRPHVTELRFDVIAVDFDTGGRPLVLDHFEGAF
jgi:putative endonuclease